MKTHHVEVKTVDTANRVTRWTRITKKPLTHADAKETAKANGQLRGLARVVRA